MSSREILTPNLQELSEEIEEYFFLENFLSTIVGLTIGLLIGYFLFKKYIYHGPNSKDIVNKTYKDETGRPYRLEPTIVICPTNYSMHKLKDKNFKAK